jgi:hypothetical protein
VAAWRDRACLKLQYRVDGYFLVVIDHKIFSIKGQKQKRLYRDEKMRKDCET